MANKIKLMRSANRQKKREHRAVIPGGAAERNLLQQALEHHRAGRFPQAEALYRQILEVRPDHPDTLNFLGMLAHQVGKSEIAVKLIGRVLNSRPDYVDAHINLGLILNDQGRLEEAEISFRRALVLRPDYAEAHSNLGNVLMDQGRLEEAVLSFRQALALQSNNAALHFNLANALKAQGKLSEAEASYRQALALQPDYAEAFNNLGSTLNDQGKLAEAETCFRQALSLRPDYADAHNNLGVTLKEQGNLDEARSSFYHALALKPDFAEVHNNLGNLFKTEGKPEEAALSYRRALALQPDYAEALSNLGIALKEQGELEEAEASYRRALEMKPDYAEASYNLGNVLNDLGKLTEAVASYRRALRLRPDYPEAHSNLLLCLNYLPNQSVSQYLEQARSYGRNTSSKVRERYASWICPVEPARLRVGVVSGDLRHHSVGYFLENMLVSIDPARMELFAYPTSSMADEFTDRLRSCFTSWKSLAGMNDEAAARLIHDDGIHVLLDLSGHTSRNRLPVFAWKPAPVQTTWLGYSASTGLPEMDYLLADPYVVPPGEESHFTEAIWRLPESYLCFSPPRVPVAVKPLPAIREGRITFGSFNNPTKMNDAVVALWAKVLHAVPNSRLFLKGKQFLAQTMRAATRQRFAAFGIVSERLLLEGRIPKREEHLAAYSRMDLALDPFPYNGTTTSVEGLWMGVPFIPRRGDRFVSHVGESIAHNTGLADWIAMNDEDYVAKAVAHAADLEKLVRLRAGLREQVALSPLVDGPRFARHFESALWGMWHRFLTGR